MEKAEDLFFKIYDVISHDLVKIWVEYVPPCNSISTPRMYHEVYEENVTEITEEEKPSVGSQIWSEVMTYLPVSYLDSSLIGRSHRVRFIRESSQNSIAFPRHFDELEAPFPLEKFSDYDITAQLTILIYLNEGFAGGNAHYYLNDHEYQEVVPKTGRLVIFDRRILHCAQPLEPLPSSFLSPFPPHRDKYFLKCCALYGRRKEPEISSGSRLSGRIARSIFDEYSQLVELLRIFKEHSDAEVKRRDALTICELVCRSSETIFNQEPNDRDSEEDDADEDSEDNSGRSQREDEVDTTDVLSKLFFVVITLFQSSRRDDRLLAHRTLSVFPRKQFLQSDLALLLGETLLRDSMDQDLLIASLGIKGLFWYSNSSELWEGYLVKWLTHPSNVIRESCLVGLLDVLTRFQNGWHQELRKTVSHHNQETSDRFWASISQIVPVLEGIISTSIKDANSVGTDLEIKILREKSIEILQLCPFLR